jgi:RNA polymerase sigma-54 factor
MKQSLDLRLGQHLTITPQLQQAIRLLQLSSIELQQEIQDALESNPLLEENEDESSEPRADGETDSDTTDSSDDMDATAADGESDVMDIDMERTSLEDGIETDGEWDDGFEFSATAGTHTDDDSFRDIDARNSRPQTLRDHLHWQMQMTPFSSTDRQIALALIDAINEDGYLSCALDEIQHMLGATNGAGNGSEDRHAPVQVGIDEIEAVLHQIQNFDPVGIGARNLGECLKLQLKSCDPDTPFLDEALLIATPEGLASLANRDYPQLRRLLKMSSDDLLQAVQLIQSLNPRPGNAVAATHASYVTPDIVVRKFKGVWRADLNGEVSPRLRINHMYEKLIHRGDSSADNQYLRDQLQQARWFIKSLQSRNETLLKVSRTIVDRQRAFFDHGPEAMKPLVLHDIAATVGMHESTISRVTTNKYMLTPRGIFELKYFFSSHVTTADGGTCSATAIRSLIKKIVESETPAKPVSDSKITEMLGQQGINVARRTIAKYRESMNIPPSNQRKALT